MIQPTPYTAAQIATALEIPPAHARRMLGDAPSVAVKVRGQLAPAWELASMPAKLRAALEGRAKQGGWRDAAHLLMSPAERWKSPIPFGELAEECKEVAEARRTVLGRLMPEVAILGVQHVAVKAVEASKHADLTARTVRRWIDLAVERDGGRGEWDRLEIYIDEARLKRAPVAEQPAIEGSDFFQSGAVAMRANPTGNELTFWKAACHEVVCCIASGTPEKKAQKQVLRMIQSTGLEVS